MKVSNTKLTASQKVIRKDRIKNIPQYAEFEFGYAVGVTVLKVNRPNRPNNNTAVFAVAIASPNETKIRRKVGEYLVLDRYYNGETANLPVSLDAQDYAEMLADYTLAGIYG